MTTVVTVSVVFTDLVGSTELASRLGSVAAEELRATHFSLLREAITASGGTEVKNLGDGVMVVFPSLGGALDGAVGMQQSIERHNRKGGEHLGVRVGVSNGDAVLEDADYFGEPIVEAARLCSKASGGQILTSDTVRALARRSDHEFASVGMLELKGLPEPVDAFEVQWAPLVATPDVPMPARLSQGAAIGFCGRDEEQELLGRLWKHARGGDRRLALLSGEAGMGKTRLSTEVARYAYEEGAIVLYGRCDEEMGLPYQPFVEALDHCVAHAPLAVIEAHVARYGTEVARLVPALLRRLPELHPPQTSDPETERYLLLAAIVGLLAEMSTTNPIVLVLDDLHWADKPTLLLLQHLVTHAEPMALLVIGTYRDTDMSADHPLVDVLADLRREPGVERLPLTGLDDVELLSLMEQLAGHEMDSSGVELAHALRRETAGNPFFASEILRHLAEIGAITQNESGRWIAALDVESMALPDSVREVVGRRVRRLSPAAYRALSVAAVIGRDFDVDTLCAVDDAGENDVLDALDEAVAASVIAEVPGAAGRFTFVHALMQHTLYGDLSAARRSRMHGRVGEVLEYALGADPGDRIGELAHHWLAATRPADNVKAVGYVLKAGERALATLAPDEAVRWFTAGLELLEHAPNSDETLRCEFLVRLGEAQRQAGVPAFRQTLLDAAAIAQAGNDSERLVRAALANQRGVPSRFGEVDTDRVEVLGQALEAVGDRPSAGRACLLAMLASELCFSQQPERTLELAIEAQTIAAALDEPNVLVRVLNLTFYPCWLPERFEESMATSERALAVAQTLGDPIALGWAAVFRFYACTSAADANGIRDAFEVANSVAGDTRQPALRWFTAFFAAWRAILAGDVVLGEQLATDALQVGTDGGQLDAFIVYGAQLIGIRWHQGRLDELLDLIGQAAADNPGLPAFRGVWAVALCQAGQHDRARELLDDARHADFYRSHYDYIWLSCTMFFADAAATLGDREAAATLYDRLAPHESQGVTPGTALVGVVADQLARLAVTLERYDDAERHFATADALLRKMNAPFWLARNTIAWSQLRSRLGEPHDPMRPGPQLQEAIADGLAYGFPTGAAGREDLTA